MRTVRCRHLPVLDESGRRTSIVSQRDLFQSALLRALGYGSRARDQVLSSPRWPTWLRICSPVASHLRSRPTGCVVIVAAPGWGDFAVSRP